MRQCIHFRVKLVVSKCRNGPKGKLHSTWMGGNRKMEYYKKWSYERSVPSMTQLEMIFLYNGPNGKLHSIPAGSSREMEYHKKWSYESSVHSVTRLEMIFLYNDPNGKRHYIPTGSNRKMEYYKKWSYERSVRLMTWLENDFSLQMIQMENSIPFQRVVTEKWSTTRNDLMKGVCTRWLGWKWFFFTNDSNGKLDSVPTGE